MSDHLDGPEPYTPPAETVRRIVERLDGPDPDPNPKGPTMPDQPETAPRPRWICPTCQTTADRWTEGGVSVMPWEGNCTRCTPPRHGDATYTGERPGPQTCAPCAESLRFGALAHRWRGAGATGGRWICAACLPPTPGTEGDREWTRWAVPSRSAWGSAPSYGLLPAYDRPEDVPPAAAY